jgi:hypothetical protein
MPAKRRAQGAIPEVAIPLLPDMPIAGWMDMFQGLYGDADAKRSPVEMWVAATSHCASIGEAIRRMHFSDLMREAAHTFCWMCSFVLKCRKTKDSVFTVNESFSSIVAAKYPGVCGHCLNMPCRCNPEDMDRQQDKAARYKELLDIRKGLHASSETYTVSEWLNVFKRIYGQQIHLLTLESIGFHFLEEAGEELRALRALVQLKEAPGKLGGVDGTFLEQLATFEGLVGLYKTYGGQKPDLNKQDAETIRARLVHAKIEMFAEFADTFSWLCSILNKVMSIARNCDDANCRFAQDAFRRSLEEMYRPDGTARCPACRKAPCKCVFYN